MKKIIPAAFTFAAILSTSTADAVTLKVYEWEGYISTFKDGFEEYAKKQGKDITLEFVKDSSGNPAYISNAEDIFNALRDKKADIVTPTHNYYKGSRGRLFNLLHPLETSKIDNYDKVLGSLRSASFDEKGGSKYALPLLGGAYSLAYNADRVSEAPTSWNALIDPKMKTSITSGQIEANVYVAALINGEKPENVYSVDKINAAAAESKLKEITSNVDVYWDGMADPEAMKKLDLVTTYWFGVAAANKAGQNWKFAKPVEGQTVWLDNISISADTAKDNEKLDAAYTLLGYMISPNVQKTILDEFGSIIVNGDVKNMVSEEVAAQYSVGDESFFKEEYFWQPLEKRTVNAYQNMWKNATK